VRAVETGLPALPGQVKRQLEDGERRDAGGDFVTGLSDRTRCNAGSPRTRECCWDVIDALSHRRSAAPEYPASRLAGGRCMALFRAVLAVAVRPVYRLN